MIRFKTIRYKNFLSTGNNGNEIQLDATRTTLVCGVNSAGKCLSKHTTIILKSNEFGLAECSTLFDVYKFYQNYPEHIGKLYVYTRLGFFPIEAADITAPNSEVYRCKVGPFTIEGSPSHKVWTEHGWMHLKDIEDGTRVLTRDGYFSAYLEKLQHREDLYDIQVETVHEYYSNNIVSHNSTMIDALSFVLFGRAHRNINKPQLINSINEKKLLVEIDFSIGTDEYTVKRGMKPNLFEIWKNGKMINQDSKSRDYQKVLETNILKLNHKSFHQIVVLGSSSFIPFMQLPAYHRREVIEDLLDISIFSKMNLIMREKKSKLKDLTFSIENAISHLKSQIELQKRHIESLKKLTEANQGEVQREIRGIEKEIERLQKENEKRQTKLTKIQDPPLKKVAKDKQTLYGYEGTIKSKIRDCTAKTSFFIDNDTCPTCSQAISPDTKDKMVKTLEKKLKESEKGYELLKKKLAKVEKDHQRMIEVSEAKAELLRRITHTTDLIEEKQEALLKKTKALQKNEEHEKIQEEQAHLGELITDLTLKQEDRIRYSEDAHYYGLIDEMLKDTGIKTKIIRQYLPIMNKMINDFLQKFEFFVSFTLDENFNEKIRSRYRDDFSYSSFSEGEKARIDLSLMLTWRQIAKMKNSTNTNLLILDEIMDSSLDSSGLDALRSLFGAYRDDTNIFVISHRNEFKEAEISFERTLMFSKKGNFTQMEEIR